MTETCRVALRHLHSLTLLPVRPGRRRWSAAVVAILLPAIAVIMIATTANSNAVAIVPAIGVVPADAPTALRSAAAQMLPAYTFTVGPAEAGAARAHPAVRDTRTVLAADMAVEKGLQVKTILAARAITAKFPQIHSIGGVRPDGLRWHPDGLALDVMIADYRSPRGIALGDRIAAYVRANADQFGLDHLIWRQVIYLSNGTVRKMGNRGSDDANHFTHLHIATKGGGFPTGQETYSTSFDGVPAISAR